jgi:hypothetical protein
MFDFSEEFSAVLDLPDEEPVNDIVEQLQYGGKTIFNNASYLVFYFATLLLILAISKPLEWTGISFKGKLIGTRLKETLLWSGFILFFIEGGLDFSFCAMIEFSTYRERLADFTYGNWISLGTALFFLLCFLATACFNRCYLRPNYEELKTDKMKKRYGAAYSGMNIDRDESVTANQNSLLFMEYFVYRRIIFSTMILVPKDQVYLQFFILQFNNLASTSLLIYYNAYEDKEEHMLTIFTECVFLMATYFVYTFTDLVTDPHIKQNVGLLFIFVTIFNLVVLIFFAELRSIKHLIKQAKAKFYKKNAAGGKVSKHAAGQTVEHVPVRVKVRHKDYISKRRKSLKLRPSKLPAIPESS